MCLFTLHFCQGKGISGKGRVSDELIQLLHRQSQNFRGYKRKSFTSFDTQLFGFLRKCLIGRCRSVFILAHMRVYIEAFGQQ
ncbi:hypothetical protein D3C80_1924260 [compost metagenome]